MNAPRVDPGLWAGVRVAFVAELAFAAFAVAVARYLGWL